MKIPTAMRVKLTRILNTLTEQEREAFAQILKEGLEDVSPPPLTESNYPGKGVQQSEINYEGHGW